MPPPTSSHLSQQCDEHLKPIAKTPPTRYCAIGVTSETSLSPPPHHWHNNTIIITFSAWFSIYIVTITVTCKPSTTELQNPYKWHQHHHIYSHHYLLMSKRYSRWPCRSLLWVEGIVRGRSMLAALLLQRMRTRKCPATSWTLLSFCPQVRHYYLAVRKLNIIIPLLAGHF